ncbi:MAG: serine/threonine-protein kinase [Burkholderiales bacterium]|nr:serine/threonine-protein kinase [Burkholderiales bacterium]
MTLVKRCPTCGTENAPTAARCGCGAFLIGIDLTERVVAAPSPIDAEHAASLAPGETQAQPAAAEPRCGYEDCAQPNPAGASVCVYCNRALGSAAAVPAARAPQSDSEPRSAARLNLIRLPPKLAQRFDIEQPLKAAGGEADLFIVRDRTSAEAAVLKLYRHGIEPPTDVLERVTRAAPDQLVRLIEHGRDQGVPYELLEYCQHGSLRTLLKGRALPAEAARTLLVELADAIAHLHECGIVHRDLKPENVLIRGLLPLDLVLTDFGIASITDATMHYTSAARTLRYSAPEAGSNWVGRPSDYWSLGMMLIEALTGRHPFDGLSDAVIAHWLATRPIEVAAIEDPRWQRLCRGLLTRDPAARWGADEIRRWLQGDDAIALSDEQAAAVLGQVSPYQVGDSECTTARELAVALAADWAVGVKDLKRGMLRAWLQNELRDQNLARAAADAEEALELSDDERLLRLLLRLDPALPPVFKGYDISIAGLAALTRKALEDHNEARQAVLELIDRRMLALFPGNALQDAQASFEQAKQEFEQALARGLAAGASRELIPDGREWQLRMLLFVLEPPKGLVASLRASARRVGSRAARRCAWYRALGDIETASAATLAAMILLGPPAAQEGMEIEREAAQRKLEELALSIDACPALSAQHAAARDRLLEALERSGTEDEVLGLPAQIDALAQALERSLASLWEQTLFEGRALRDGGRIATLRRRIGEWAGWRAGEAWADFGARIESVEVIERRGYNIELATQIESRRIPYQYGAADSARMAAPARAVLADVWSCQMPALPAFGAELKLARAQELRCPRCGCGGRVELQESWGSLAYPFATTFSCHDKVGVQCQTRIARASRKLPIAAVPQFVADFVAERASEASAPERVLEVQAPSIPARWLERMPAGTVQSVCAELMASAAAEVKPNERATRQRLRIEWGGLAEVRYRYRGKPYVIWVPERSDATPIALAHPLPSAPTDAGVGADPIAHDGSVTLAEDNDLAPTVQASEAAAGNTATARRSAGVSGWVRSLGIWLAICAGAALVFAWIVNWKP